MTITIDRAWRRAGYRVGDMVTLGGIIFRITSIAGKAATVERM